MWTAESGCGQTRPVSAETMEGYIKVQRPGDLRSEETLARYAPGKAADSASTRTSDIGDSALPTRYFPVLSDPPGFVC